MSYKSKSAEKPSEDGLQYHVRLKKGDVPATVLLPGDPKRVELITGEWRGSKQVADYRQYVTRTGTYKGLEMACTSTGIGCPGLAIAVEELVAVGAKRLIRVGSCGSMQPEINLGDVVISSAAVRLDGTSKSFVRTEYPAVSDYRVVSALVQAAEKLGIKYHVGITATTDTFTVGQGRPAKDGYLPSFQKDVLEDLQKANVLNFEMEASTLFVMASIYKVLAGCVCVVVADRVRNKFEITSEMQLRAARVASEAAVLLAD